MNVLYICYGPSIRSYAKYYCLVMVMVQRFFSSSFFFTVLCAETLCDCAYCVFIALHSKQTAKITLYIYTVSNRQRAWTGIFFLISSLADEHGFATQFPTTDTFRILIWNIKTWCSLMKCTFMQSLTCFLHYLDNKIVLKYFLFVSAVHKMKKNIHIFIADDISPLDYDNFFPVAISIHFI